MSLFKKDTGMETMPNLGALRLRRGMTVEVLTVENKLTFVGKVDQFQNGSIIIRDSAGDELPPVLYNREVKLRFFQGQQNLVYHGKICGSSRSIWKVDRLENQFNKEQRAFFRQRISPNSEAICTKHSSVKNPGTRTAPCLLLDISAGGIMIASREEYMVEDKLTIDKAIIVPEAPQFTFRCQIRRALPRDMGRFRYGCQFETLTPKEQDRLLEAIFIAQRKEIQTQKRL